MSQNIVIAGADNKVRLTFAGVDLTAATELTVIFGAETYTLTSDPTIVLVESATVLALSLNATNEIGPIFVKVKYHDASTTLGIDITSQSLGNLPQIVVARGSQLIIEDGSIIDNANAITTDDEFLAYAKSRGVSVPDTEPSRDALQIQAVDYLFGKESKFSGCRTSPTQALPFPRKGSIVYGYQVASDVIHANAKKAAMELAFQINDAGLYATSSTQNVKKEKLGTMETEYFEGGSTGIVLTGRADVYLKPLYKNNGNNNVMTRV